MKEDVKGLDFIMRLRPITYHLDVTADTGRIWGRRRRRMRGRGGRSAVREAAVLSGFCGAGGRGGGVGIGV